MNEWKQNWTKRGACFPPPSPLHTHTPTARDGLFNFGHNFLGGSLTAASDFLWIFLHSRLKVQKLRDQSEESIRSGYGVGTHWVRSYTAWDINGAYARCTECVWSGYGLQGGGGDNIGSNQCRINFKGGVSLKKNSDFFTPPELRTRCVFLRGHVMVILVPHWSQSFWTLSMLSCSDHVQ